MAGSVTLYFAIVILPDRPDTYIMRSVLFLGFLTCITIACATATDGPEDGTGGGSSGGAAPGTGGEDPGPSTGGVIGNTGGLGQGGAGTGGTMSTGGDTATGGAATGGAPSGGSGGGTMLDCEGAVEWVANQHSVNYPPGQLFTYEGGVYRYDGQVPMTYVNGDCPPDRSGADWCQTGQYPYSEVTDC